MLLAAAALGCGGSPFTAGPPDGGPDASTVDAAQPPSDAPSDTPITDAPTGPYCAQHPGVTFCDDFERYSTVADVTAAWSGFMTGNGAESLLAPGFMSQHALGASAGSGDSASIIHAPFQGRPPNSVRVEYDLRVDAEQVQLFGAAALTSLILGSDPSIAPTVYLYLGSGGSLYLGWSDAADAGRGFHYQALDDTPTLGSWDGRWGIAVVMVDGTMTVTHAGVLVATGNQKLAMGDLQLGAVAVQAGLSHDAGNTGTVTVAIDNLVVDVK